MRNKSVAKNLIDRPGTAGHALVTILTPHERLLLVRDETDAPSLTFDLSHRLQKSFLRGCGHGLLQLGAGEAGMAMPPAFGYWRESALVMLRQCAHCRALQPILSLTHPTSARRFLHRLRRNLKPSPQPRRR